MSTNYRALAQNLMRSAGGVGSIAIQRQQPFGSVGQVAIYPQQVGSLPAQAVPNLGQAAVNYTQAAYNSGGLTYCGFGRTLVPAGATGQRIHLNVRRPFLPQQLWMPSTIYGIKIVDFIVEGNGLFANPGGQGVPNELFSEVSNMNQIEWLTLNPDTGGDFLVDNPTLGDLWFEGGFWGTNVIRNR